MLPAHLVCCIKRYYLTVSSPFSSPIPPVSAVLWKPDRRNENLSWSAPLWRVCGKEDSHGFGMTALVVHCVGTRLAETLTTARHQREACVKRCYETHLAGVNCVDWHSRRRTGVVTGVGSSLRLCALCGHPHLRCRRRRRPRLTGCHLSSCLSRRRGLPHVETGVALSNLCMHILMRLSFVRLTRFLARLMLQMSHESK